MTIKPEASSAQKNPQGANSGAESGADCSAVAAERLTFPKSERLRHKILVDNLFSKGTSIYDYPFRLTYRTLTHKELEESFKIGVPDGIAPLQMMVTVPKKKRRHAVDRVLMRRRIREAWRLQRRELRRAIEEHPELRTVSVALIYISTENVDSAKIRYKLRRLIDQITTKLFA
ncbi:MAG: ribonuclease P protein component [Muribaculaceae bacterium]|nr:ribonuclease P protein component [Muribaculaceae bacterium]